MTLHFHGTPITPQEQMLRLGGRHFCVSFAEPRQVAIAHDIGQSVLLDNGAFSMWTAGKATDWPGYYAWADRWLDWPTTWAIVPDVIDGDAEQNDALLLEWPHGGERGAPVWHLHEPLERLLALCDAWPRVCFGSSGEFAQIGTSAWHRRVSAAWNLIAQRHRRLPWVHMLRGMALRGSPYPFASLDSTHAARNFKGSETHRAHDLVDMVARIDAVQCPGRWKQRELPGQPTLPW